MSHISKCRLQLLVYVWVVYNSLCICVPLSLSMLLSAFGHWEDTSYNLFTASISVV